MSDLIDRKEAIDAICKLPVKVDNLGYTWMIAGDVLMQIDDVPSAEPERKWIPVTERLPEDGERVLITHKGGVSFGWYNGIYWERGAPTNHRPLRTVIAWMPLPVPYEGN